MPLAADAVRYVRNRARRGRIMRTCTKQKRRKTHVDYRNRDGTARVEVARCNATSPAGGSRDNNEATSRTCAISSLPDWRLKETRYVTYTYRIA